MKRKSMKAHPLLLAALRRAAVLLLLAAAFAPPAFPDHWGMERKHWGMEWERERHGRNAYSFVTYFYIEEIERDDGKIEIEFNAPVDPRTVSAKSFIINGEPLPARIAFKLSRKGNKVEIMEAAEWRGRVVSIEVVDLYSVNGTAIETIPPIFLEEDEEFERDDDLESVYMRWYDENGGRAFRHERR